jgi:periplasmic protein CpxP/Spy
MRNYLATSILALTLAVSGAAFAQDAQNTAAAPDNNAAAAQTTNRGDRMFDQLSQKLNLNDEQKQQLKPIFAERRQKMTALRASSDSKSDKRKEAKQIMQDSDAKVKGVLTADQYTQYTQLKQQMREQHKEQRNGQQSQQPQQ